MHSRRIDSCYKDEAVFGDNYEDSTIRVLMDRGISCYVVHAGSIPDTRNSNTVRCLRFTALMYIGNVLNIYG